MRKLGLISKFIETGKQTIKIDILPNISRSRENQTMKLSQLLEYNVRNIFLKKHAKNETGRLVSNLFWFLKKLYMR